MHILIPTLLAWATIASAQMPPMMPPPHPLPPPPPPYNLYGPINPYASGSSNPYGSGNPYASSSGNPYGNGNPYASGSTNPFSSVYPPQQMMPPPSPYPMSTSASYASPMYPMMAAAAPFPAYGVPPPMMYPPPYQTYSGSGPNGDPFTSTSGICKFSKSQYESPVAQKLNGYLKKANVGMICTQYN